MFVRSKQMIAAKIATVKTSQYLLSLAMRISLLGSGERRPASLLVEDQLRIQLTLSKIDRPFDLKNLPAFRKVPCFIHFDSRLVTRKLTLRTA
jgi:hypothetical protein